MGLMGPDDTCCVCYGSLDRPYLVTSHVSPDIDSRFAPWSNSVIHFACLAQWPEREAFARASFVDTLTHYWPEPRTMLLVRAEWFLAWEPPEPERLRLLHPTVEVPSFVIVRLARWPLYLASESSGWSRYVGGEYRRELFGPVLKAADAVMTEVRSVAPSIAALRALLGGADVRAGQRSLVDLGRHLETLWGDAAGRRDWKGLEDDRRAEREACAEQDRLRHEEVLCANEEDRLRHEEEILRSNEQAGRLLVELVTGTPLRCPHCRQRSREMRFIDPGPHDRAYFICPQCGCSFAGAEALRRAAVPWRRLQ